MIEKIGKGVDREVLRLLRSMDEQAFEARLDALKVIITWYATRAKLEAKDTTPNTGALLDELRKSFTTNGGGGNRDLSASPAAAAKPPNIPVAQSGSGAQSLDLGGEDS